MTDHPLTQLAARIGCDVDALLTAIAGSEHLCNVIADALTRKAAQTDAAEHRIGPPQPVSPLTCRLWLDGSAVVVRHPEWNDALRLTVKALGYAWDGSARQWAMTITPFNGPALDRLVEAGCALLSAGFILSVPSAEIVRRIEAGEYQPVQTRWVTAITSGQRSGWFHVQWGRDDDLYPAAKRIHGAQYIKPFVAAPPESYDEVLDFAQEYGYSISEGARKLADAARARAWEVAVVQPPPLRKRERIVTKRHAKPQPLPETAPEGIDHELLDAD